MYVIYRKLDRLIAGHVYERNTRESTEQALAVEIGNILISELSGVADDYGVLDVPEDNLPALSEAFPNQPMNFRLKRSAIV